ncbi:MAG: hypothetical protein EP319_13395 [Deltaproteobacteria bacterium]|nr:MAG: hypothetical protein EP319_13395 [Deltaproteobacteria bacterium]
MYFEEEENKGRLVLSLAKACGRMSEAIIPVLLIQFLVFYLPFQNSEKFITLVWGNHFTDQGFFAFIKDPSFYPFFFVGSLVSFWFANLAKGEIPTFDRILRWRNFSVWLIFFLLWKSASFMTTEFFSILASSSESVLVAPLSEAFNRLYAFMLFPFLFVVLTEDWSFRDCWTHYLETMRGHWREFIWLCLVLSAFSLVFSDARLSDGAFAMRNMLSFFEALMLYPLSVLTVFNYFLIVEGKPLVGRRYSFLGA